MEIIINANREGYGTDQIRRTMTVGELIEILTDLSEGDMEVPVFVGNDRQSYGWYTYGGIERTDVSLSEEEEEDDYEG